MSLVPSSDSTTSALRADTVALPVEIWEQILTCLSDNDLQTIRSLNRVAYEAAVRAHYGTHWIVPNREKVFARILERVCDTNSPIIGLVHTLYVHSNLNLGNQTALTCRHSETKKDNSQRLHFPKERQQLFEKVVSNPNLRVDTLAIFYDGVILPHTHLIWLGVAHSLVRLELQFVHESACDALLSFSGNTRACCPSLRSFVLLMGPEFESSPVFYSTAKKRAPGHIFSHTHSSYAFSTSKSTFLPRLEVLQAILPPGLSSLGIHWLSNDQEDKPWVLDSSFLHPKAYPDLKKLHISGLSMDRNPSLSQFLLARAPSLQCLTLENIRDTGRLFHRLPVTEKLGELSLDQWSYTQLFEPNSFQSGQTSVVIQRYAHLRRLEIRGGTPTTDEIFMLLVELGRGRSNIQELSLSLWTLFFAHLRVALLLLSQVTDLTFSGVGRFDPLMRRLSRHPVWTDLTDDWTCTVRFVGLAQAGRRLGPTARRAMNAALRKDIDRTYAECVSSLGRKNTLYSSIKRAIKTAEAQVPGTSGLNALEDHTKATLELVEECLVE